MTGLGRQAEGQGRGRERLVRFWDEFGSQPPLQLVLTAAGDFH